MAELHVVGQVLGGSGFQLDNLFCKWFIETGSNFRLLQGLTGGQTHCDYPNVHICLVHMPLPWGLKQRMVAVRVSQPPFRMYATGRRSCRVGPPDRRPLDTQGH
mmetsp:Transcript_6197/g.20329  ORF Transcript_6197/g.20329 Transcript_6197/m.20329 type:complete len:104 (+) Transcript_6197:33-344(+)